MAYIFRFFNEKVLKCFGIDTIIYSFQKPLDPEWIENKYILSYVIISYIEGRPETIRFINRKMHIL